MSKYNTGKLSRERYLELLYFCRQYEVKRLNRDNCYSIGAQVLSDMPKGGNATSTVERQADRAMKYSHDVEVIERSAMAAVAPDNGVYKYLLLNVTQGIRFEDMPVPCGRRKFYQGYRKAFFNILDEKK